MAAPQPTDGHHSSTSGPMPSQSSAQQHHNYASYWYFMQQPQPQQQATNAQQLYDYPYFANQQQPAAAQQAPSASAANVNDPWSQLANTFSNFQPSTQQSHQYQQQQHHHHQQQHQEQQHLSQHQQPQPTAAAYYASNQHYQQPTHGQYQNQAASSANYQQPIYHEQQPSQGHPYQQPAAAPDFHAQYQQEPARQQETGTSASYSHQATPDLVVAAGAGAGNESVPETQPTHSGAPQPVTESTPPDLWFGHARQGVHGPGPDVVASRPSLDQQAAAANGAGVAEENLDDVALNNSSVNEASGGVMMNLDDYFQAPESDRPQSLVSAAGAIFSMAGGVNADHQAYHRQRSSESGSRYDQHRLGFSELYTHSYYETDIKSPTATTASSQLESTSSTVVQAGMEAVENDNEGANELEGVEADAGASAEEEALKELNITFSIDGSGNMENEGALELEGVEADTDNVPVMEDEPEQVQEEAASGWDDWGQDAEATEDTENNDDAGELEGVEADTRQEAVIEFSPAIQKSIDQLLEDQEARELEDIEADAKAYFTNAERKDEASRAATERGLWDTTPVHNGEEKRSSTERRFGADVDYAWSNVDWDAMNRELTTANLEKQSRSVIDAPVLSTQMSIASTGEPSLIIAPMHFEPLLSTIASAASIEESSSISEPTANTKMATSGELSSIPVVLEQKPIAEHGQPSIHIHQSEENPSIPMYLEPILNILNTQTSITGNGEPPSTPVNPDPKLDGDSSSIPVNPEPSKQDPIGSSASSSPKKKRQESLHKRFQEASAKSRLALERLQREKGLLNTSPSPPVQPTVSLWSSTDQVPKSKPVLLMPISATSSQRTSFSAGETPVLSPAVQQRDSKIPPKTSTPKENAAEIGATDEKKGNSTTPKTLEVAKAPKKPPTLPKSHSADTGPGGILKKDPVSGKVGRNVAPPRRGSAPEEDEEERENAQVDREDRRRPSSRGSIHSAYEGYNDDRRTDEYGPRRDNDWYRSYYFKRRPYSRASDREDWRYPPGYERYRPRSTQSYAGGEREYEGEDDEENEGEDEKSENGSEDYDGEDERREMEAYYHRRGGYPRHPGQRYPDYYRYPHAYQHYQQQPYHLGSFDPAWQRYIMEYQRYYGHYPTYDQLHRMWTDQQKRAQQQQAKARPGQQTDAHHGQTEEQRKISGNMAPAIDIPGQPKALFTLQYGTEEEQSQPSMSRHGSEKSFEIRSEMSSTVSGAVFGAAAAATVRPEKIREPLKHSVCHAICRFGAGGHLIMVTSSTGRLMAGQQSAASKTVEIRNLRTYLTDPRCQSEMEKIEKFPGPLSSKDTAKLAVVQFCQKKLDEIAKYVPSSTMDDAAMPLTDRDSVLLVWRFLLLLVRQNGVAMGNDLAQLLLETRSEAATMSDEFTGLNWDREVEREPFRHPHPHEDTDRHHGYEHDGEDATFEASTDDQVDNDGYGDEHGRHQRRRHGRIGRPGHDRTLINCSTQTSDLVEFQFRQLLLGGNKKEALEWAIKYRLWGHALFLAMKVDQRTHTNVMTRFANSLALNDPLQTLYQMLSGGTPYAVTRVPDDKWGDWRPHLAMILSNLTPMLAVQPDPTNAEGQLQLQRQQEQQQQEFWSILTMGKTLMHAGRPYAAHFCYLCCHVLAGWDVFSPTQSEDQQKQLISLIGAFDEEKPDEIFTLERCQCTEVYEYAIGLRNQPVQVASSLPAIQIHKWKYTQRLAEYGFREEAFRYLYQLNATIQVFPQYFTALFARAVYELAGRLQQFDPTVETIGASLRSWQQPAWLNELAAVATALEASAQDQVQNVAAAPVQEQPHQQPPVQQPLTVQQPLAAPLQQQQPMQQQYQGILQPAPEYLMNSNATVGEYQMQPRVQQPPASATNSRHSSLAPREWDRQSSGHGDGYDAASQASNYLIGAYDRHDYDPPYSYSASPTRDARSPSISSQASIPNEVTGRGRQGSRSYAEVATPPPHAPTGMHSGQVSPSAMKQTPYQQSVDYWEGMATGGYDGGHNATPGRRVSSADHDLIDNSQHHPMMGAVVMTTGPSPQTSDFGTPGSDNVFGGSPIHVQQQMQPIQQWAQPQLHQLKPTALPSKPSPGAEGVKSAPAALGKPGGDVKRNQSWVTKAVGSMIYKIMPKGPNEMILPDDKTKSIVWDADRQRWVNVNGEDDDSNQVAAPPPSDFQLGGPTEQVAPVAPAGFANAQASSGGTFLEQAYQNRQQPVQQVQQPAQQFQQPMAQQPVQTQQAAVPKAAGGGLNRYRKNENRRYVDVFGTGGGGGGGMDPSFAPPIPMASMGNVNVFTPEPEEN